MTVTTSSQVSGVSSFREMVSFYPTRWGRELASADPVGTPRLFLGDTGWLTPHQYQPISLGTPNELLPRDRRRFRRSAVPIKRACNDNSVTDVWLACFIGDLYS